MLPASRRLRAVEVRRVLKEGRSLSSGPLAVKWIATSTGKVAVVVSKKTAKKAILRNALRRSVYRELTKLPRAHVVFFVRKAASLEAIRREVKTLCSKLT